MKSMTRQEFVAHLRRYKRVFIFLPLRLFLFDRSTNKFLILTGEAVGFLVVLRSTEE